MVFPHNYCTNLTAYCQCKYAQIGLVRNVDFAVKRGKLGYGAKLFVAIIFARETVVNCVQYEICKKVYRIF